MSVVDVMVSPGSWSAPSATVDMTRPWVVVIPRKLSVREKVPIAMLHITRTNHLAHLAVFDIVINLRRP